MNVFKETKKPNDDHKAHSVFYNEKDKTSKNMTIKDKTTSLENSDFNYHKSL